MTAFNVGNVSERNFNAKAERKLRKPLIEKRRRERINCSLEQLKGIMVDAYNLDQSKLEKADVLEITVQHMEGLQRSHGAGPGSSLGFESRQRYSTGYIQCMHEVHNLLLSCPGMDKTLGARLLNHLLKSLPHISAETGGSAGNGGNGGNGGPSPASPCHSPPSLSMGAYQPHSLQPPISPSPPSPTSPRLTARLQEGAEHTMSTSPSSPTPSAHPSPPSFFPGGDPSMWRPW